jgi:transcription elongation factor/antiterminator RfaH
MPLGNRAQAASEHPEVGARRWYVAQALPRKEEVALQNLGNQGFAAYCPRIRRTRRHARKFTTVREPLFPGYVFIAIDVAEQPWRSINGTLGISRILTDGAGPVALQDGLVEQIMAATEAVPGRAGPDVGQDVRLRTGPFADFIGCVVGMTAGNRVQVLLRVMNREVTIDANVTEVDLLGRAA